MRVVNVIVGVCLLLANASGPAAIAQGELGSESCDSPALQSLAGRLTGDRAQDRAAVSEFWGARKMRGPLVEPINDDSNSSLVTFLWMGDGETRSVNVQGGPTTCDSANWMKNLRGTNLWYRTERIPNDARFIYFFQVNRPRNFPRGAELQGPIVPALPDPLNPRTIPTRDGSVMELPQAPPQPWLKELPGEARGNLLVHSIRSEELDEVREFTIYTPLGLSAAPQDCGLLVLFDGKDFLNDDQIPGPVILDNLISQRKIPPLVTVFVHQKDREIELACSQPFADFVATELVPWVRKRYRISQAPNRTAIGGISMGGLMAAYCGLRHSGTFGNVMSLSGSFWWSPGSESSSTSSDSEPGWLKRQFAMSCVLPIRFYLAPGVFEQRPPVSLLAENRKLRDVLTAKGWTVTYDEFSGGHDYICWRSPFVNGLQYLMGEPKHR